LFLDRDGVINSNHGYVHTQARTDWVPGIFTLVRAAHDAGFLPVVVTNQAGIARGLYTEAQFLDYTHWVHGEFMRRQAPLLATVYCPHHPSVGPSEFRTLCNCRKPGPDMILAAAAAFAIDLSSSVLLGDSDSDIEAASRAGVGSSMLIGEQANQLGVRELHSLLFPENKP
jgi:D-glycero-D-manno-heptose 1,7-bisphosphate phosphatase